MTACHTDVGIKKKTNQDSMLIEQANTEQGDVLFAAVCDGMGGLQKGELASAVLIKRLSSWFNNEFPRIFYNGFRADDLRISWDNLITETNLKIQDYSVKSGFGMGTTCVTFLAHNDEFYIMCVGDSRVYLLSDQVYQLTKDQSYVQREIDLGRMTPAQAAVDPKRSVLLQCVGASPVVEPDFFAGNLEENCCYMLCSDGFSHMVSPQEMYECLGPMTVVSPEIAKNNLTYLTETAKVRGEKDNISGLLIRTY